jgi:peptidoglycan/xylan/chitin deacetylase (PgdA/CDA1 family)
LLVLILLVSCSLPIQDSTPRSDLTSIPQGEATGIVQTPTLAVKHGISTPFEVSIVRATAPAASPFPTFSPIPTEAAAPTLPARPPPESPAFFNSPTLRREVAPQEYISDQCEALRMRWDPEGSPPHTIVVPIMFHSITKSGRTPTSNQDITEKQFAQFVDYARYQGFETITTHQLDEFLYHNARIPPRSMLLILDDRRPGVVEEHFMPVLVKNNWTVTLAWISADNGPGLWARMEELHDTGHLDVQSHGYRHMYLKAEMPIEEVQEEILAPVEIIEAHFGERPLAYIWPGGNYNIQAVQVAREAGYRLGFTVHSPMPLRFNWIPLVAASQEIGDPLMVLPRAWSYEANLKLDQAVTISQQAREFAIENYAREAEWYRYTCGEALPPLSATYPETLPFLDTTQ